MFLRTAESWSNRRKEPWSKNYGLRAMFRIFVLNSKVHQWWDVSIQHLRMSSGWVVFCCKFRLTCFSQVETSDRPCLVEKWESIHWHMNTDSATNINHHFIKLRFHICNCICCFINYFLFAYCILFWISFHVYPSFTHS